MSVEAEWRGAAHAEEEHQEEGVWLTVGDLMSALLLIFALLFIVALLQLQEFTEQDERTRIILIQSLQQQFDIEGIQVELNEETGDISILDSVLFDVDQHWLKPEGVEFLERFIPVYSRVIFSDPVIEEEVVRVIIEGHTSSSGSFEHNMQLSLLRANSVTQYISEFMEFPNKGPFLAKVVTAGRGEIEAEQAFDDPNDRKVVFRFQFRGQEFRQWAEQMGAVPVGD